MIRSKQKSQLLIEALEDRICLSAQGIGGAVGDLWSDVSSVGSSVQVAHNPNTSPEVFFSRTQKVAPVTVVAPSGLAATAVSSSEISLSWKNNDSNATGFVVETSPNGKAAWTTAVTISAGSPVSINYTTSVTGLSASTTYYFRVRAARGTTLSNPTATAKVTTNAAAPAPVSAPTQLTATAASTSEIDLAWTNNASDATSFNIETSADGSTAWTPVNSVAAGTTVAANYSFAVTGLNSGTQSFYRVFAVRGTTQSAASNVADATTLVPAPTPTPTPTPTPDPTPTPTPDPVPTPILSDVTISTNRLGTLTQLAIVGTSDNDSITVTQSGSTLTIVDNGFSHVITGSFGEIMIQRTDGGDSITIDSSVNINTLIYAGGGGSTISARGTAKNIIVSVGNSAIDTLTGNGINTSFWVDTNDVVNASNAENNLGGVHRIGSFYQPFTTTTTSPDYVPLTISGQNLTDPTDSGSVVRLTASFWGQTPSMTDVNQGSLGDCYYLADLASLANQSVNKLRELAVDLGDGTYAVQFTRNGVKSFVRVDGDLAAGGWNGLAYVHPGSNGSIWAPIMEKAYAFFRSARNTYASLGGGWMGTVFSDFGIANLNVTLSTTAASTLYSTFGAALNAGRAVTVATNSSIINGAPLVGNHAYSLIGVNTDGFGNYTFTVRNPWGTDGAGNDDNPYDGIIILTAAQLQANMTVGSMVTV